MKKFVKILKWTGITLVSLVALLVIFVYSFSNKKYDDTPYPEIKASTDSAVIARGKYLAYGPAHCAVCHVPMDKMMDVEKGMEIPLSGGWELDIPPGIFRSRNITPDMETGIGKLSDGQLARILRYNVGHDGRVLVGFMPFQMISDDDLTAIISFLRSQQPVKNEIKPTEYTFLGKAVKAFGLIKPEGPTGTPPKTVKQDTTAEYGSYLVNSVANCKGCHTNRDMKTGLFIGPDLAGGGLFPPDKFSEGYAFVPPNLTPDPTTGIMTSWDEKMFVSRFKAGRVYKGSPMPWGSFSRMDESDLKAIYRYLHNLAPIKRKVEKAVYAPGEKLPEIK